VHKQGLKTVGIRT